MAVGKGLRFEILKRDGYRCRYCGATAVAAELHVDHVVPIIDGGNDDPANLVAACIACNQGKGSVPLDKSKLGTPQAAFAAREHAAQIQAYLDAQREVEQARSECVAYILNEWIRRVGTEPPTILQHRGRSLVLKYPLGHLLRAIDGVAGKHGLWSENSEISYFYGVLRGIQEDERQS